jgi:hypothetical protein
MITLRPYCAGCILRIFEGEVEMTCKGRDKQEKKAKELAMYVGKNFSFDVGAYGGLAWNVNKLAMCGKKDPYGRLKRMADGWVEETLKNVKADNLREALKLAVGGNALDFAHIPPNEALSSLKSTLRSKLDIDHRKRAISLIKKHKRITYVLDNAGEILFDRVLIKRLVAMGKEVSIVVRSSPFLNDATMEDVKRSGLDRIAEKVIEYNGIGFRKVKGLAISKGQAAFITMAGRQRPGIFLLKVKCPVIASSLKVKEMASVVFVDE